MAGEWREATVGEIASSARNALVGGPFGSNLVSRDYADSGVPVIRGQNMGERWIGGEFAYVNTEKADSLSANIARPGDVVFTQRGTLGQVAVVPENTAERYLISQSQMKLTVNDSVADPLFIYYVFRSPSQHDYVLQNAIQTGVPHINLGILRDILIPLPPISEQRAIAHILGTLDDKIELNRRMNDTLEEMARAIFKSWFVDFDPVRAKVEGRDPGLPQHIADLFPDRFEDSELGEIPAGWESWCVSDVGNVICGKTPLTKVAEYYGDTIPFITIPDMRGKVFAKNVQRKLSHLGAASQPKKVLPAGALCVSCIVTPGLVVITSEESHTNQQINTVVPENTDETYFWFWIFRNLGEQIASGGSGGSVFANLSTGRFSNLRVLAPCAELRRYYHLLVASIFDQILRYDTEMDTLAAIRNTLLPRLISGELRVSDVSRLIGVEQ